MPQLARPSTPSSPRGLELEVVPITASITWDSTYNDRVIRVDSTATITLPANAPVGSNSTIFQYGTGAATVAAGSGATLVATAGQTTTNSRYDTIEVYVGKLGYWTVRGGGSGKSRVGNLWHWLRNGRGLGRDAGIEPHDDDRQRWPERFIDVGFSSGIDHACHLHGDLYAGSCDRCRGHQSEVGDG